MRHLILRLTQVALLVGLLQCSVTPPAAQRGAVLNAPGAGAGGMPMSSISWRARRPRSDCWSALLIGLRLVAGTERLRRLAAIMLASEAALLIPLTQLCAPVARIGVDGGAIVAPNLMDAYAGYESAKMLDKLLIAALYFLKTVAFGFLIGLAAFGAVWSEPS